MITLSVVALVGAAVLIYAAGFATGGASTAKAHYRELQWLIREQRITASQVRHLNHLLDVPITDPDEEEPPPPSWPARVTTWARALWDRLRPTPADPEPADDDVLEDQDDDEDEPEPDLEPVTQPISTPGPATIPTADIVDATAAQLLDIDAMYHRALAEIHGRHTPSPTSRETPA